MDSPKAKAPKASASSHSNASAAASTALQTPNSVAWTQIQNTKTQRLFILLRIVLGYNNVIMLLEIST